MKLKKYYNLILEKPINILYTFIPFFTYILLIPKDVINASQFLIFIFELLLFIPIDLYFFIRWKKAETQKQKTRRMFALICALWVTVSNLIFIIVSLFGGINL